MLSDFIKISTGVTSSAPRAATPTMVFRTKTGVTAAIMSPLSTSKPTIQIQSVRRRIVPETETLNVEVA